MTPYAIAKQARSDGQSAVRDPVLRPSLSTPAACPSPSTRAAPAPATADAGASARADGAPGPDPRPSVSTASPPGDTEALGDEIARLSAHMHAAEYRLLTLLRAFDERGGWAVGGFRSCAHWLSWRTGLSIGPAREKVRVARALAELPLIGARMERGQFSYSKVRALTRVATRANEAELVNVAEHGTVAQVERLVRGWRRIDEVEARAGESRHDRRALDVFADEDGMYVVRGRLEPEVGSLLVKALEVASRELYRSDPEASAPQRRADALGEILRRGGGPRVHALLHVVGGERARGRAGEARSGDGEARSGDGEAGSGDGEAGSGDREAGSDVPEDRTRAGEAGARSGGARTEEGVRVSAETSRRLTCDAHVTVVTVGSGGEHGVDAGAAGAARVAGRPGAVLVAGRPGAVLDVGRRRRTVPARMRRALELRDGGRCRFPGCESRWCDAHHVRHWSRGGATSLDNLVLLCRVHHRLVHEGGFRVEVVRHDRGGPPGGGGPGGRRVASVRFRRPDGAEIPGQPRIDPVAAGRGCGVGLEHWHGQAGIDHETTIPRGMGEPVDYGWALEGLRRLCTGAEPIDWTPSGSKPSCPGTGGDRPE